MKILEAFIEFLLSKNVDVQNEVLDLEYTHDKLGKLEKRTWWEWINGQHRDAVRLRDLNRMQNMTHDIYQLLKEFKGANKNGKND